MRCLARGEKAPGGPLTRPKSTHSVPVYHLYGKTPCRQSLRFCVFTPVMTAFGDADTSKRNDFFTIYAYLESHEPQVSASQLDS
jgi:hypothetical protein